MTTVPYVLSADDSAQANAFARTFQQLAHPADVCKIVRYGMALFQQQAIALDTELEFLCAFYMADIPGLTDFVETIIDDNARTTAFERAVALNVYLLMAPQPAMLTTEAQHGSI